MRQVGRKTTINLLKKLLNNNIVERPIIVDLMFDFGIMNKAFEPLHKPLEEPCQSVFSAIELPSLYDTI